MGLDTLERTTPVPNAPALGQARVWADPELPFRVTLRKADGRSLVSPHVIGIGFRPDGEGRGEPIHRKPRSTLDELAAQLPNALRAEFLACGRRLYPDRNVPAPVAEIWEHLLNRAKAGRGLLPRFAREGLANAIELDGVALGKKERASCGGASLEVRTSDRRTIQRLFCGTHRCSRCSPGLAEDMRERLLGQLRRDRAACRPAWWFATLTLDRGDYYNAAEACRRLGANLVKFVGRLRRGLGSDLAYFVAVEWHHDGYPHAHLILRSTALSAFAVAASAPTLGASTGADRDARRATFPEVWGLLGRHVRACGFGEQYDVGPAEQCEAVARDLCKTTQLNRSIIRDFRRFRPSGRACDGRESSFFVDAPTRDACALHPQTDLPLRNPDERGEAGLLLSSVEPASPGLPQVRPNGDLPTPSGEYDVRVDHVVQGEEYLRLVLGVLSPAPCAGMRVHLRLLSSEAGTFDLDSARARAALGVHSLDADAVLGREARIRYVAPIALDPVGARRSRPLVRWVDRAQVLAPAAGPGAPLAQVLRSTSDLRDFAPTPQRVDVASRETVDVAIVYATPEQLRHYYVCLTGDSIAVCDPRFVAVREADGSVTRELRSFEELPVVRTGVEAVADYVWWLRALLAAGRVDAHVVDPVILRCEAHLEELVNQACSGGSA
ncbi:MAG: hypothetical protein Q8P18_16240 [Pseudomonadota bacterium]|nr:hypothetical protein [Pseudomonadota bacterium]